MTLDAVWHNDIVKHHPDTFTCIEGLLIPRWREFLEISSMCYDMTNLGYLGLDIILDETKGPLMLELNARPGLNIQIANNAGLKMAYNKIKDKINDKMTVKEKIDFIL